MQKEKRFENSSANCYGDLSFVPVNTLELRREDTEVEEDFSTTAVDWLKD